jgi:lysylphosphatidylglycerol synthetase-like protein (DUF2156 family)
MSSCSVRLDWEYRTRSRWNRLTIFWVTILGALLILLFAFAHMALMQESHESFLQAFYWSAGYAMHREPEPPPHTPGLYTLALIWILFSETYWAALLGLVATWIGDFFER